MGGAPGVWLGQDYRGGGMPYAQARQQGQSDSTLLVPYEQARNVPLGWSEQELKKFVNQGILNKIPGFGTGMGMPEIVSAWDDLIKASAGFNQGVTGPGQKMWTPWDVMDSYKNDGKFGTVKSADGDWLLDASTGERIKYIGPRTKTSTAKKIDLSNPEDVKALTTQMLTELLGRAPNADELAKYRSSINGYEREHPLVTTTTETLDERGEVVETSQKTSGGVSAEGRAGLISEAAKQGPEYGKFQSATTYWDAMMQMISGG